VTCQARRRALEGAQSSEDVDKAKMDNWQAAGQGRSSRAGPQQQGRAAAAAGGAQVESTLAPALVGLTCLV